MPTIRNTRSSGAPKRIATKLDMMPARTKRAPSRMPMLIVSSAAIVYKSRLPLVMPTPRAATANYHAAQLGLPSTECGLISNPAPGRVDSSATAVGIACGAGAALFWAAGFVVARHGIALGFSPAEIVFHRFVWAGLVFLPFVARQGFGDLGGVGWGKAVALTLLSGPPLSFLSYAGFLFVPLAHGGVAIATIGAHGLIGDLSFATAGLMFAAFATLLRRWHIAPTRAVAVTSVVSLVDVPIHWLAFGFAHMIALGLGPNLLQLIMQGIFAGAGATYLFTRSVVLLGAGRAAVFPSLVPGFTLLIGFLA